MQHNETEEKILNAAMDVISEHTISNTRMHLIAQKAGIPQSNIHYYFQTKNDLLVALMEKMQKDFNENRKKYFAIPSATLREKIMLCFEEDLNYILKNPKYEYVQFDYWSIGRIDEKINSVVFYSYCIWREHIKSILLANVPELSSDHAESISITMVSMMIGGAIQYLNKPGFFNLKLYFEFCTDMVLHMIECPEEIEPKT